MKFKTGVLTIYVVLVLVVSGMPGGNRDPLVVGWDKVAHGLMFLVFGVLSSWTAPKKHVMVITGACILALVTELLQIAVPGRTFEFGDLLADMSGALAGLVGYQVTRSRET